MNSPATALAWEFWRRHRWAHSAFALYLIVTAIITATTPLANPELFASLGSFWFVMGLCHLIVVFSHGSEIRLESGDSGFPSRMFVLPIRTSALVGWSMLLGVLASEIAWQMWHWFVLRPCGIESPIWWTPMLAAIVAATQAVLWYPYGLPWVRLPVAIVVITALVRAPIFLSLMVDVPESETELILSLFAVAVIPVAYRLACSGVARARCGDTSDWFSKSTVRTGTPWRERSPFTSPMRAQVWYEWRLRGKGFPIATLLTIGALMLCGLLLERDNDRRAGYGMTFLLIPFLLAGVHSSSLGSTGDWLRLRVGQPLFLATRPMSNTGLIAAKIRVGLLSAICTWGATLAVTLTWLGFTDGFRGLPRLWEQLVATIGDARAIVLAVGMTVAPIFVFWRLLVGDFWVGLTGRNWIGYVVGFAMATLALQASYEWTTWKSDPARQVRFLALLPWLAGAAVAVKFLAAGWMARILIRRGEVTATKLRWLLGVWLCSAFALFGMLVWFVPAGWAPLYGLALGTILFLPMARLAAAPLALAWNRHR